MNISDSAPRSSQRYIPENITGELVLSLMKDISRLEKRIRDETGKSGISKDVALH
jgi:hypothetical protein